MNVSVKITEQHKKLICECFHYGLIRPNEFSVIKDYLMDQEINIRKMHHSDKWFGLYGKIYSFKEEMELSNAYRQLNKYKFSLFNIVKYQVSDLYNANRFYSKTYAVRRASDMLKETDEVYVDSDVIRSLQWLVDNRQHVYDLLERYQHCLRPS
jgi:AAA+ ATPase superfamily predicted ATPase